MADTGRFAADGLVYFDLPNEEITQLKTYTATYKFRLGDSWVDGEIVPFTLYNEFDDEYSLLEVIVR